MLSSETIIQTKAAFYGICSSTGICCISCIFGYRGFTGIMRNNDFSAQNVQNIDIRSAYPCIMCQSYQSLPFVAIKKYNKWVHWRPVYRTELKRYLCIDCARKFRPSLSLSLLTKNAQEVKNFEIYSENGNLLPSTHKFQMDLLPHTFPLSYLGEKNIVAEFLKATKIFDCTVLSLVPDKGQEYYMDIFLQRYGYIYTCARYQETVHFPLIRQGDRVLFKFFFDFLDRPVTKVFIAAPKNIGS